MMIIKDNRQMVLAGVLVALAVIMLMMRPWHKPPRTVEREVRPSIGSIQTLITSTATVQPQNRLEIKPPINGRINEILVKEGEMVKAGQTLVWMSSTERAALLDAARARGPEAMAYWQDVYKATPLISPIDAEVIVSQDEPGQIVSSSDAVVVLSDRLIVQAQVDETDIGGVRVGQEVMISLDAYPQIKVKGRVDHVYYESKVVNNVTIYQVDIVPETVPGVFRSGMTATVQIAEKTKEMVLTIPLEAVKKGADGSYVLVRQGRGKKTVRKRMEPGLADEKNVEVVSGLSPEDRVVIISEKYKPAGDAKGGTNPLMPFRRRPAGGGK